jgi:hypothetical protein
LEWGDSIADGGDGLVGMGDSANATLRDRPLRVSEQQATDLLNVSGLFLIGLIDDGKIPFNEVRIDRWIRFEDLMAYKQNVDQKRLQSLEELAREAQELDMGY